jgi:cyclophilin family peptidyl-prolyl cis-trans isomerase
MMLKTFRVGLLAAALALAVPVFAQEARTPAELCESADVTEPASRSFEQAEQVLQSGVDYRAIFCTDAGPVYIDLLEDYTPVTVNSFVFLAEQGYYNNTTFHRVIQDFMAQGGDPTGTGTGGPGYQFQDEFLPFLRFDQPGLLAMANAGAGTNGSQFFITTAPTPHLNDAHTIFGIVLEGQENVTSIRLRDPAADSEPGTTLNTVVIVTDPAEVTTTYEDAPSSTQEDVQAVLDTITSEVAAVSQLLGLDENLSGMFTAEEVVAATPEGAQDALNETLTANNFDFRAVTAINNTSCDLEQAPYVSISYTLDAFGSSADASAALASGVYDQVATEAGFAPGEATADLRYPLYTKAATGCEVEATHALTHWQRGRYVVTAEVIFPVDSPAPANLWLSRLIPSIYENFYAPILVNEVR